MTVTDVTFVLATEDDVDTGLLGFVSCTLNGKLVLDGIALRETSDGRFVLSFPARTDRFGHQHHIVRPLDDEAREEIEQQILAALEKEDAL